MSSGCGCETGYGRHGNRPRLPCLRQVTMVDASVTAEIDTVYRALDGGIHHARCGQRMVLQARSAEELHVSCLTCAERSEEHTSELQSRLHLVCRLLLEKKKQ